MSEPRFAIIDPAAGVSGDMLLGALLAAGAQEAWLRDVPARLGVPEVAVELQWVDRCGIRACKVNVRLPGGEMELPSEADSPPDPTLSSSLPHHSLPSSGPDTTRHQRGDGAAHRHVAELIALVEKAPVSAWVRDRAVQAFRLLADAEARVHGTTPERVALHEVGAMDALVDIVAVIEGFEQLGIRQRIPQAERQTRGHLVAIRLAVEFAVEETRRFQRQQHDPLDRRFDIGRFVELTIDDELLLLRRE